MSALLKTVIGSVRGSEGKGGEGVGKEAPVNINIYLPAKHAEAETVATAASSTAATTQTAATAAPTAAAATTVAPPGSGALGASTNSAAVVGGGGLLREMETEDEVKRSLQSEVSHLERKLRDAEKDFYKQKASSASASQLPAPAASATATMPPVIPATDEAAAAEAAREMVYIHTIYTCVCKYT